MDIVILTKDPYLYLFAAGLLFYLPTILLFIEKIDNVLKSKKEKHDLELGSKYDQTPATIRSLIEMFDSLRESRFQYEKIARILDVLHWVGVLYLSGCILGFILKNMSLSQDIAIVLMGSGFLYFFVMLIYLIMWYRKNKQ